MVASCIAKITSCIIGLETACRSTLIATSAIPHGLNLRKRSRMLITSPFPIKGLACTTKRLIK